LIVKSEDPHREETLQAIRDLRPTFSSGLEGFGIPQAPLLDLAPQGVLSYHHGDMREYRGPTAGLLGLYNGEKPNRVTVQRPAQASTAASPLSSGVSGVRVVG
jgi:hypothetical protein